MKYGILGLAVATLLCCPAGAQAARTGDVFDAWMIRCADGPRPVCEAFQRLTHAESGMRVMEFAISFPPPEGLQEDKEKTGKSIAPDSQAIMPAADRRARGVIVLPLGIMLPDGVMLTIDNQHRHKFEVRYCTAEGCYAYITLQGGVVDQLRRAMNAQISFRTLDKRDIKMPLNVKGLGAALLAIK